MAQNENSENVEKVVAYLRGCMRAASKVGNPLVELQKARALQVDENGRPKPGTRLSRMSADEIKRENKDAERIAALWDQREELAAEQVLLALLERDCPSNSSLPSSIFRVTHWGTFAVFARFVRHLNAYEMDTLGHEKEGSVGQATKVAVEFGNMTRGLELLRNPLVVLRELEDKGEDVRYDNDQLVELEGLSRRLWHMATVCGVSILRSRMLLQPDCGEGDLALVIKNRDLFGLAPTDGGDEEPVANMGGSRGSDQSGVNRRLPF